MTGEKAAQRLATAMMVARTTKLCTIQEYVLALPLFNLTASQWLNNGKDVREDQYQNVWNVIIQDWNKKEEAKN